MDDSDLQRRAELARRLKAARWLAGGIRPSKKDKKRGPYEEVYALEPGELATRPGMAENQITASKIGSIERMERHTPPMEVRIIARALGVSSDWLGGASTEEPLSGDGLAEALGGLLDRYGPASGPASSGTTRSPDDEDPPAAGEATAGT